MHSDMSQATVAFDDGISVDCLFIHIETTGNWIWKHLQWKNKWHNQQKAFHVVLSGFCSRFHPTSGRRPITQNNWDINIITKLPTIARSWNQHRVITASGLISRQLTFSIRQRCWTWYNTCQLCVSPNVKYVKSILYWARSYNNIKILSALLRFRCVCSWVTP